MERKNQNSLKYIIYIENKIIFGQINRNYKNSIISLDIRLIFKSQLYFYSLAANRKHIFKN